MNNYEKAKRKFLWSMGIEHGKETIEQCELFDETISADIAKCQDAWDGFTKKIKGYFPWMK